jgi:2-phospho-L-lactate guanylyltransferase
MHAIVIPFRGPASGKSRLAGAVSDTARRQIARAMFQHVLNVACSSVGARHVVVVTGSNAAASIARRAGALVLREARAGHNEAVAQGVEALRSRGATTAAVVSADLPLLAVSDLAALERHVRAGRIGIAADGSGKGTNAISLPLSVPFTFHFGPGSLFRHRTEAMTLRTQCLLVGGRGLKFDVDTPDDLKYLADPAALLTLPASVPSVWRSRPWTAGAAAAALCDESLS